jgi:hypothetical protein
MRLRSLVDESIAGRHRGATNDLRHLANIKARGRTTRCLRRFNIFVPVNIVAQYLALVRSGLPVITTEGHKISTLCWYRLKEPIESDPRSQVVGSHSRTERRQKKPLLYLSGKEKPLRVYENQLMDSVFHLKSRKSSIRRIFGFDEDEIVHVLDQKINLCVRDVIDECIQLVGRIFVLKFRKKRDVVVENCPMSDLTDNHRKLVSASRVCTLARP